MQNHQKYARDGVTSTKIVISDGLNQAITPEISRFLSFDKVSEQIWQYLEESKHMRRFSAIFSTDLWNHAIERWIVTVFLFFQKMCVACGKRYESPLVAISLRSDGLFDCMIPQIDRAH